jgi:hypothetical protein
MRCDSPPQLASARIMQRSRSCNRMTSAAMCTLVVHALVVAAHATAGYCHLNRCATVVCGRKPSQTSFEQLAVSAALISVVVKRSPDAHFIVR